MIYVAKLNENKIKDFYSCCLRTPVKIMCIMTVLRSHNFQNFREDVAFHPKTLYPTVNFWQSWRWHYYAVLAILLPEMKVNGTNKD